MKKKLGKILVILGVISVIVNLMSCANMSNVEVKQYAESESKREEELNKEIDKIKETKEDNRTETIIGGEEKALDKVRESKEGKEPETFGYTINEKGEKVYRVYNDYYGEEVDNPELYKDEYYIGESGKKKVPTYDKVVDKWSNYSDEVREIIAKAEGKDYATSKTLSKEEKNRLHSAGLYMITKNTTQTRSGNEIINSGGSTEFLTKSEIEQYVRSNYKFNQEKQVLEEISSTGIWDSATSDIVKNVKSDMLKNGWEAREEEREQIARMYAKKNTDASSPAQYINSLGNGKYVVKCGLVVPSEENATYYESLRGQDKINYWYTEWMVFKQNNQGRISFAKDSIPRAKYKENTFGDLGEGNVGMMLWVSRTPNEERVTFWGKPQYAHVHKTFPEYYDKCGGTDMAFMQWGAYPMAYAYDYTYNKIVEGVFEKEKNLLSLMDRENW